MLEGLNLLKSFCSNLPEKPGIYKMLGENNELLYIGKAKNLKKRVIYYTKQDIPTRLARMVFLTRKAEYLVTKSEAEAFLLEASQIKLHQPRFNILLKDDKSFPFLKITNDHKYPQILKYRGKKAGSELNFGPFASISDLERTIGNLRKIFKLRSCSDSYFLNRKRPCLQYQIKRCSAPCTGKISQEEYRESVDYAISFLNGKTRNLQADLAIKMQKLSEEMNFEKAAEIRDNIKALSYIQTTIDSSIAEIKDCDVMVILSKNEIISVTVFFYRASQNYGSKTYFPKHIEGVGEADILSSFIGQFYQTKMPPEKILTNIALPDKAQMQQALQQLHSIKTKFIEAKKSSYKNLMNHVVLNAEESLNSYIKESTKTNLHLKELQKLLNLEEELWRIEVYDNSHIMGKFAVGAMIVAGANGFEKNEYRKFTILTNLNNFGGDDYQMMREVMLRRIKRIKSNTSKIPSLIIIDGGKAHMRVVDRLFKEHNIHIPFICMSKGEKRNAGGETFHAPNLDPFTLSNDLPLMKYLQILRDEVHNFAIKTHRQKRARALTTSELDNIANIGSKRKKLLLNHFGSIAAIKSASEEELAKIPGISENLARNILGHFH